MATVAPGLTAEAMEAHCLSAKAEAAAAAGPQRTWEEVMRDLDDALSGDSANVDELKRILAS